MRTGSTFLMYTFLEIALFHPKHSDSDLRHFLWVGIKSLSWFKISNIMTLFEFDLICQMHFETLFPGNLQIRSISCPCQHVCKPSHLFPQEVCDGVGRASRQRSVLHPDWWKSHDSQRFFILWCCTTLGQTANQMSAGVCNLSSKWHWQW